MRIIDLRSDTVTQPTPAMREANIGATLAAVRNFFSLGDAVDATAGNGPY